MITLLWVDRLHLGSRLAVIRIDPGLEDAWNLSVRRRTFSLSYAISLSPGAVGGICASAWDPGGVPPLFLFDAPGKARKGSRRIAATRGPGHPVWKAEAGNAGNAGHRVPSMAISGSCRQGWDAFRRSAKTEKANMRLEGRGTVPGSRGEDNHESS